MLFCSLRCSPVLGPPTTLIPHVRPIAPYDPTLPGAGGHHEDAAKITTQWARSMWKYIPHLERRDLLCNRRGGGLATALLARSSERPGSPRGVLQEVLDLSLVVGLDQLQTPLGVLVARVQVVDNPRELCTSWPACCCSSGVVSRLASVRAGAERAVQHSVGQAACFAA